ncbi:MAG TPA: sugar ABC transporter permease [Christensenellaceae bacterium]|jgi:ABC-type sugar transport system permease subunit|nr:sugar ABC transporter permease [Christensenellaceae bacterium]
MKRKSVYYTEKWKYTALLMILPALLVVFVFTIYPFLRSVRYAFTDYNMASTTPRFIGLTNYVNMVLDKSFSLVVQNSLKITFVYTVMINIFSLFLSILIYKVGTKFGNLIKTIIYFPQLLSMVVVGFLWRIMFNYNYGPINSLLSALGVSHDLLPQWLGDVNLVIPSVSVALVWLVAGYYAIVYFAGLINIPHMYYEVAAIEGATPWKELIHVTLPFLAPSITISTVLLTVESLSVFAVPAAMTDGGGPGRYGTTMALWAYNTYYSNFQYGKAIAISVVLGLVAILLAFVEMKILLNREDNVV